MGIFLAEARPSSRAVILMPPAPLQTVVQILERTVCAGSGDEPVAAMPHMLADALSPKGLLQLASLHSLALGGGGGGGGDGTLTLSTLDPGARGGQPHVRLVSYGDEDGNSLSDAGEEEEEEADGEGGPGYPGGSGGMALGWDASASSDGYGSSDEADPDFALRFCTNCTAPLAGAICEARAVLILSVSVANAYFLLLCLGPTPTFCQRSKS